MKKHILSRAIPLSNDPMTFYNANIEENNNINCIKIFQDSTIKTVIIRGIDRIRTGWLRDHVRRATKVARTARTALPLVITVEGERGVGVKRVRIVTRGTRLDRPAVGPTLATSKI